MKLTLALLMLCALAAAAPSDQDYQKEQIFSADIQNPDAAERNSILINVLIRQLFNYIRFVINNGSSLFGTPPLDPLELDQFNLNIPAGIINLEFDLKKVLFTGIGGFVVHRSNLVLSDLSFDLDISVPLMNIQADEYNLIGDLVGAIPLFGQGEARFVIEQFRFQAKIFLKQSDDGQSALIDRIENVGFQIPSFQTNLTGVIGGGDIDAIVNAIVDEVIVDYVRRFEGAIARLAAVAVIQVGNPILNQLDTWRYLEVLL